jgi:hypothetical protein
VNATWYFFECRDCGYDSDEVGFLSQQDGSICPLCAGDSGHNVLLKYREATPEEIARLEKR